MLGSDSTPHLLFVDDESALRSLMAERLAERGFEVAEADSGEKALEYLDQFAFDILITDLRLPGVDGRAVVQTALDRYPDIIAIIVTGYGTVQDAVEAIKQGAADFVTKPIQFDALLHVIHSAVERRRAPRDGRRHHLLFLLRPLGDALPGRFGEYNLPVFGPPPA